MEPKESRIKVVGISIIVVFLATAGYFLVSKKGQSQDDASTPTSTTTPLVIDLNNPATSTSGYTITPVPVGGKGGGKVIVPSTARPIVFSNSVSFSSDVKNSITENIKALQALLTKDSLDLKSWIELGGYQKITGDYEGALMSWKYVRTVAPSDYISVGNIADLYAYYIKDNGMAETYYREAISKGPTQAYLYLQLAYFYRDVFKDTGKAGEVIDQGLLRMPQDKALLQAKAILK